MRPTMPIQDQLGAVHTLIHIGCGANPNINEYISLAEHVWLIDADTDVLNKLDEIVQAAESDSYRNVYTRLALADAEQRKAIFYRYSLPWANGVTPVEVKTQDLYPGLQRLSSKEQTTSAISCLVKECLPPERFEANDNHVLLLDCGYQNEQLMQALDVSGEISLFSSIVVLPISHQYQPLIVPPSLFGPVALNLGLTLPEMSICMVQHPLVKKMKRLESEAIDNEYKIKKIAQESDQRLKKTEQYHLEIEKVKIQLTEKNKEIVEYKRQSDKHAQQAKNTAHENDILKHKLKQCSKERDLVNEQAANDGKKCSHIKEKMSEIEKELYSKKIELEKCLNEIKELKDTLKQNNNIIKYARAAEQLAFRDVVVLRKMLEKYND